MTAFTVITNDEIDQDSPATQPLFTALRDNPIAMMEGAIGAPRLKSLALSTFFSRLTFASSSWVGVNGLDRQDGIEVTGFCRTEPTVRELRIRFSTDDGVNFGGSQNVASQVLPGSTVDSTFVFRFSLMSGNFIVMLNPAKHFAGTLTVPANANAFQISSSGGLSGQVDVFGIGAYA